MENGDGKLIVVTGMQYGSEGKGAIASYLAPLISMGVRTGAANAGHTIYFNGKKFVMRQLPTAWVNPHAKIVIGAGALISLPILLREINLVSRYTPIYRRLFIDRNAHVILDEHIDAEAKSDLGERIGSTSAIALEGVGAAMAAKVLRERSCMQAKDVPMLRAHNLIDTAELVNDELDEGQYVLIEGTQGIRLSLDHGEFPYVTSRDTSVAALAASVGVNHAHFDCAVIGVVRTFPIRVAGNSGPFDTDAKEVSWKKVASFARAPQPIIEHTSVTGNVRRVATFSREGFRKACRINRPTEVAVTFADYLDWRVHEKEEISQKVETFVELVETIAKESSGPHCRVTLVKTGPETTIDFEDHRRTRIRQLAT